jgi:deazaflavin-dependent oxidoreductase (nitroreductase family)
MRKYLFRLFTAIHLFIYRLSGGRVSGEVRGLHVLLLTTTGRKSGKPRTMPLGYFKHDGGYVITASNSGSDHHPGWYYNLKSSSLARIQIKNNRIPVRAEEVTGDERERLWSELIRISPGYADYQKHTSRKIPMVILHPSEVR